jgi:hypothetical protein
LNNTSHQRPQHNSSTALGKRWIFHWTSCYSSIKHEVAQMQSRNFLVNGINKKKEITLVTVTTITPLHSRAKFLSLIWTRGSQPFGTRVPPNIWFSKIVPPKKTL